MIDEIREREREYRPNLIKTQVLQSKEKNETRKWSKWKGGKTRKDDERKSDKAVEHGRQL